MASVSTSGLSFSGLATGIDTDKIITGLTQINQQRIDTLKAQQDKYTTSQTTFTLLQAKLLDLQTQGNALARSAGGAFDGRAASVSDDTAVTATAGTAAVPGTYTLTVGSLARAQQATSDGFADPNAAIKQGALTFQVGSGTATTVNVTDKNNTLQGLADAINAAGGDVRASIINDGSAAPYRLLLTATRTGAANTISVTGGLGTGTGADVNPLAKTIQAATDASVSLGTGAGALTVTSASNQITGLIPGVSLNLLRADPAKPLTLSVTNDTEAATKAVQGFVDSYNAAVSFINDQSKYDSATGVAGEFLGNRDVTDLTNDLASALAASIPGLNPSANRLSSVGLSFKDDGTLNLDAGKLGQALNGQNGVTPADLKKLFGLTGASNNPGVGFVFGGSKTKPSGPTGYQVQVTTPATRGAATATDPLAAAVALSPPNNSLSIKLNGLAAVGVTIDPGTYTPDALAALLQQKINAAPELGGGLVAVGLDASNRLQITSQTYGSGSSVEIGANAALGFAGGERGTGANVAGNFVVNGVSEPATGSGQNLTGAAGNKNTDGLVLKSTLTAPGSADVTVSQGLAGRLTSVLNKYLDPVNGRLKTVSDGFQTQITDITTTIDKQNAVLADKTAALQSQFAAMEAAVNTLKGMQSQISGSFSVLKYA